MPDPNDPNYERLTAHEMVQDLADRVKEINQGVQDFAKKYADIIKPEGLDERLKELAELEQSDLDEMIYDLKCMEASHLNNAGKRAQVSYILSEEFGLDEAQAMQYTESV